MRIIAGQYRGRILKTLRGSRLRPTSDRLRESLFSVIRAEVPGSVFVDCYAGSGAVGLEAFSRGASQVYLIESSAPAARLIQENVSALGASEQVRLVRAAAGTGLRWLEREAVRIDICFLDPPYADRREAAASLDRLAASQLMNPGGLIIVQHPRKETLVERTGPWTRVRVLNQGSSALSFYRHPSHLHC